MRVARSAFPEDPNGMRFSPACNGESVTDDLRDDERATKLVALLDRREVAVAALEQVVGEQTVASSGEFANDELQEWLWMLLPFYTEDPDASVSRIIPRSTRALGEVMQRLADDSELSTQVRETIARISTRAGYRTPDSILAAVRPTLSYERLDELTSELLGLVAPGEPAHDTLVAVMKALALELAEPADAKEDPTRTTLHLALQLLLSPSELYAEAEAPRTLEPITVLERDLTTGDAIPVGDPAMTPFPVAGRTDDGERQSATALALSSSGEGGYRTFDASKTALASLLRDAKTLIRRGDQPRSVVENALRSFRPLLGEDVERTEKFGDKELRFTGPDVENGPAANFLYSITSLLKLKETRPMLELVQQLLETNEAAATELIHAALAIDAKSDEPGFDGGKLSGPNEFWDDLIQFGQRIITEKPGLLLAILNATTDARTVAAGKILAHQMSFKDVPRLIDEANVNSDVSAGCPATDGAAAPAYCQAVDRALGDVGMNRSIFQRTLSLIHSTYRSPNCNKEGATLTVQKPIPTTFPNPPLGPLAPILGGFTGECPSSSVVAAGVMAYPQCSLIEQKSGAVIQMQAMLDKAKVVIKDEAVTKCAGAVGLDVAATQEEEAGITGFTTTPTAKALARFIYAPRNKFLTDMFNPYDTVDGVPLTVYEPNGMYPLEIVDPDALVDGVPVNFITAARPLLQAFDEREQFDENGDAVGSYLFAELFDLIHMHYGSPKAEPCPVPVVEGSEGCTQSTDPTAKFYAYGTNAQSYEPLVAWALEDQDLLGVLSRSTSALGQLSVGDKNGIEVLHDFLVAVLSSNADIKYKDGRDYAKTNLCDGQDSADPTQCACPAGSEVVEGNFCKLADGSYRRRGRIIAGGVPPLYLMLDALNDIDARWTSDEERHGIYLGVRSTLVDQFLTVAEDAEGKTSLKNRRAYALARNALPWLFARMDEHPDDLAQWADGLVDRLGGVLGHPIAARGYDLFDQFWDNEAAGNEVAALTTYLLDEEQSPEIFADMVLTLADTLKFLEADPDITPAVRFAALGLALDAVESTDPDIVQGTAYRFLEVTRQIGLKDDGPELSSLAKMLRNAVLPMANPDLPAYDGKSPLEVIIDLVADVNREDPTEPTSKSLSAADNQLVFQELREFLTDEALGLERLYRVIENRTLPQ